MSSRKPNVETAPATTFLELFDISTQRAYGHALRRFFTCVYGIRPTELDTISAQYLSDIEAGTRDPADDLVRAIAKLQKKYAPATVGLTRAAVTSFLLDKHIELSQSDQRRIKIRSPRKTIVAEEEIFTRDHLRKILPIMTPRDRSLVLVLLSSGGRIGEVMQLRMKDIDLDSAPASVHFRRETTKTKKARSSFLTQEAVDAVHGWLLVRDQYLQASINKNRGLVAVGRARDKDPDDDRLFPFHRTSFDTAWARALERAGLDRRCELTGRHTLHPHGLRTAFRTWLGAAAGPDVAEVLMGHEGYLTTYRKYTEEDLRGAYSKHCHVLCVVGGSEGLAQQMAQQQAAMDEIRDENATLREELASIKADVLEVQAVRAMLTKLGVLKGA